MILQITDGPFVHSSHSHPVEMYNNVISQRIMYQKHYYTPEECNLFKHIHCDYPTCSVFANSIFIWTYSWP